MTKAIKKVPQGQCFRVSIGPDGKLLVTKMPLDMFSDDGGYDERSSNADERKPGSAE